MKIRKILARVGAVIIAGFGNVSVAQNTLDGLENNVEPSARKSNAEIAAEGYKLFSPEVIKAMLSSNGFEIVSDNKLAPEEAGLLPSRLLITTVDKVVPFVFLFEECDAAGCLFSHMIHPIPLAQNNIPMSLEELNDINQSGLIGYTTLEEGDNMAVRYVMSAAPECGMACYESYLADWFITIDSIHGYLSDKKKRSQTVLNGQARTKFSARNLSSQTVLQDIATWAPSLAGYENVQFNIGDLNARALTSDLIVWPGANKTGVTFPNLLEDR